MEKCDEERVSKKPRVGGLCLAVEKFESEYQFKGTWFELKVSLTDQSGQLATDRFGWMLPLFALFDIRSYIYI